jgi:flagellar protein FliJ
VNERHFRFRLERVYEIRQATERSAQEDLAASLGKQAGETKALGDIDLTIEGAREEVRAVPAGGEMPGLEPGAANAYLERLAGRRAAAVHRLTASRNEVDARRAALDRAARERQALDRLRDRRRAEHLLAAARAEASRLDELALAAHRRSAA